MTIEPARHVITADEYERMTGAGVFGADHQLELIEGEIVEMAPIGSEHGGTVNHLARMLILALRDRAVVTVQNPVRLNDVTVPQPDLTVCRPVARLYRDRHPAAGDVLLAIEVGDTTAPWDRRVKLPLYASAGIPELWLVDVAARVVTVASDPSPQGFAWIRDAAAGELLHPVAVPGLLVPVDEILS